MNCVTGLPISVDCNGDSYDLILVVIKLNYIVLYVYQSSRPRGEVNHNLKKPQPQTEPKLESQKTQTVNLLALQKFYISWSRRLGLSSNSEDLYFLEPRAWTIPKPIHQFWQSLLYRLAVVVALQRSLAIKIRLMRLKCLIVIGN